MHTDTDQLNAAANANADDATVPSEPISDIENELAAAEAGTVGDTEAEPAAPETAAESVALETEAEPVEALETVAAESDNASPVDSAVATNLDQIAVVAVVEPAAEAQSESAAAELEDVSSDPARDDSTEDDDESVEPEAPAGASKAERNPDVFDHRLIRDVFAAPHKVYLLGKVRKAAASAGDSELGIHLKTVQADILHQVGERKAAKEALCERAEALKDSTAWKVTGDAFKALFDEWKQVGAAGRELDDQLWARFNAARGNFNERRAKHFEEREQVWSTNREKKEALCARAEELAESTDWKATADAIRNLQAEWKSVGSAGREKDEALWARFNGAKQRFFDQRSSVWETNRARKAALVSEAEALKDSTDWRGAGDALKAMQAEWKNVGPAGREHEDELWTRFRAATQAFFDRRSSTFTERNKSERDNLTKKLELCARAEALLYTGDSLSASREAKDLQAQWKEIGPIPREQSEALWTRFRAACDKIFENAHGERDRQQNEWHVRMREAMNRKREQLNSLRESITHDEANIERWRETLSTLKPGGKADEIGKGLEDKIIDVMDRIRGKQERVEDLRSSINDIEAKLKE